MNKRIAILGTGTAGRTLGKKLVQLGYQVAMGSRTADNEKALAWVSENGPNASCGTFEDASRSGEIIFNCVKGEITLEVFRSAGSEHFKNKVIVDLSNPLDFSNGFPPSLFSQWSNTNSLAEEIQKLLPEAHVIKTLNMVNCEVMVEPSLCGADASMFICGNDAASKTSVMNILQQFGWKDIINLGEISSARSMEMLLPIWVKMRMLIGNSHFGFKIVRP
jgi:8-hydroxy-5-deazaflavin:NADPH oxidoreductase